MAKQESSLIVDEFCIKIHKSNLKRKDYCKMLPFKSSKMLYISNMMVEKCYDNFFASSKKLHKFALSKTIIHF